VIFALSKPDPIFYMRLGNHIVPIVKVSVVRGKDGNEVQNWYDPKVSGVVSGPFKPTSVDIDQGILIFERNEHFFGPAPKLTRIEIRTVDDPVTATALIKSGEFQAHTNIITPTIIQDLGKEFSSGPIIPTSQHFWFDMSKEPMNDPKVRQALILAIDRDGLMQATFPEGPHVKTEQIINSVPGAKDSGFQPYPHDPAKAKQLLKESSYGGPERLPKIMFVGISQPAFQVAAQYIAEQWRQNLGITEVDMKPQQESYTGPDQAHVQVLRNNVGTRVPDAISYLAGCIASDSSLAQHSLGGYKDKTVDGDLAKGVTLGAEDPNRVKMAQEAQNAFREAYLFIPWYAQCMSRWAVSSVKNIDKNLDWQVVSPWDVTIG
jgi:peptide/nickel transport system substrate-binding protein